MPGQDSRTGGVYHLDFCFKVSPYFALFSTIFPLEPIVLMTSDFVVESPESNNLEVE